MSLKFIMSQFGYAEEQGENKARADIHAAISPPLIPPGSPNHSERVLLRVMQGDGYCCTCVVDSLI